MADYHIIFDGPPGPNPGRFVEVENDQGASIGPGRWEQRDEFWVLILPGPDEVTS